MCIFAIEMKNKAQILILFLLFLPLALTAKSKRQIWVIDAGHGGHDVGCEGSKAKEKDITLSVAKRVAELVRANIPNVKVVMTREKDKYLSLEQRCAVANNADASLFLSIHVNSVPEVTYVKGTETFYGPLGATNNKSLENARKANIQKSELLAWEMQKYYGIVGRPIGRGVKRERYYVILHTRMPSILTEIGFISTASEQEYMTSKKGQEEIAQCIYRGLRDYKETIEGGRMKRTLAEMRRTGGRASGAVPPAKNTDDKQLAQATEKKETPPTAQDVALAAENAKAEAAVVLDPTLEPELESEDLSFCIQICALNKKVKVSDPRFKGWGNIKIMEKDGKYKYLYGNTSDYPEARKMLERMRKSFPDAFLVAFLGKRQISTADAQELYINKK